MIASIKWFSILVMLSVGSFFGYQKWFATTPHADALRIEVRNNKAKVYSTDNKIMLDITLEGNTFNVQSFSKLATQVQGSKVKILDEDGQTTICEMDYNGTIITITNIHGLKVSDVDIKLKMDKSGLLSGLKP